jgi:hypothetical protein
MDRFEHADARLTSGENFVTREKGVKLYDGDEKVSFRMSVIVKSVVSCCGVLCAAVAIHPTWGSFF